MLLIVCLLVVFSCYYKFYHNLLPCSIAVVLKVGATAPWGALRHSRGALTGLGDGRGRWLAKGAIGGAEEIWGQWSHLAYESNFSVSNVAYCE